MVAFQELADESSLQKVNVAYLQFALVILFLLLLILHLVNACLCFFCLGAQ